MSAYEVYVGVCGAVVEVGGLWGRVGERGGGGDSMLWREGMYSAWVASLGVFVMWLG